MAGNTLFLSLCMLFLVRLGSAIWIQNNCGAFWPRHNRPAEFRDPVKNGFKRAHFGNPGAGGFPNAAARGVSLNHVLSWRAIYERIENGMQATYDARTRNRKNRSKNNILEFINTLFSIDQDAYVRQYLDGTEYNEQDHADYLDTDTFTQVRGGPVPPTLAQKNRDYQTNALNTINRINFNNAVDCRAIKSILTDLYNAPANLRYGNEDMLGDLLDPMGDENGIMTKKEHRWYMQDNYFANHGPSGINGNYYLESSTGNEIRGHTVVPGSRRRLRWIRCYHNTHNCRV